jgi:hypothetical protein
VAEAAAAAVVVVDSEDEVAAVGFVVVGERQRHQDFSSLRIPRSFGVVWNQAGPWHGLNQVCMISLYEYMPQ